MWPTKATKRPTRPRTLPLFSLENKTCIVTGSARGLGKEFLAACVLSGARGVCIDLSIKDCESSIASIAEEVQMEYPGEQVPDLRAYQCDVTNESDVKSAFARVVEDVGKVDILVTAAGICENINAEDYEYDRWCKVKEVNLNGSWLFAREAGRHMLKSGIAGSIVLIASVCAQKCVHPQKQAAYNASKGSIRMLARSLASEWAPRGIRVNSLSPGYMRTKMVTGVLDDRGEALAKTWENDIPMGRLADASELRGTIVWMASDASSYLAGSDIVVDGALCT